MSLHDARVVSIRLLADHAVAIGFIDVDDEEYELRLEGVARMRCLDFREGNIVLDVQVVSGSEPPIEALRALFYLRDDENPPYLHKNAADIRAGKAALLHIIPSYGCDLIALCDKCELRKSGEA